MRRLKQIKEDFRNAIKSLEEAVVEAKSDLEIDGAIQRFEFTFELMWKSLKIYLESEGIICRSPKNCLKEAFQAGIIEKEQEWLSMLSDRNLSVHIYDQEASREVFERIKNCYVKEFSVFLEKVE